MRRGPWLKTVRFALVIYMATAAVAWGFVDSLLYHPEYGSRREPTLGPLKIRVDETLQLSAIYLPNPSAKFTIWYFHGNAEDLGDVEPRLWQLQARGFAVFACDYPGYGLSGGQPSEKSIYAANEAAMKHLRDVLHVPPDRLILYGRSLGGGSAVELASKNPVAGLVLESAFTSVFRVMTRWPLLPGDQFRNAKKMPQVKCPVLVMHGKADEVIPFHHGETLLAAVPGKKSHLWVDQAGHNNLLTVAGDRYWEALLQFTGGL